eukprot:163046_1
MALMAAFLLFQLMAIPLPLTIAMMLLVHLGTNPMLAISMAYEGRESDKFVTWRLISFAYLQIGMLQAMAGLYAYSVVFYGYGLRPVHLVGLDRYRVFNDHFTDDALRDAYYLWCFDPDWSKKCYYLPNFYHESVAVRGFETEIPYYTQEEFEKWQNNTKEYA